MSELEDSDLSDLAVDFAAVRTCPTFPALFVDPFVDCGSANVVQSRSAQVVEETSSLFFGEEHSGASFADVLEDCLDESQVANVESRKCQSNVAKVTDTKLERLLTGAAFSRLARSSLEQRSVGCGIPTWCDYITAVQ